MLIQLIEFGLVLSVYLVVGMITAYKYYDDKSIAQSNGDSSNPQRRRTPERELLTWMCLFGVYGAAFSMHVFRHKTQKPVFNTMLTVMLAFHTILIVAAAYLIFF